MITRGPPMPPLQTRVVSAHVMGAAAAGLGPRRRGASPTASTGWAFRRYIDGSLFPPASESQPQLSIYGLVNRLTQQLISRLGGTPEARRTRPPAVKKQGAAWPAEAGAWDKGCHPHPHT